ncbi:helix-turn-helix transcriptional regulator [Psychromicrobium xiongbiense]|uniref:helix-turn-helix transcriptional regulator n=1 Tax=Psychromicrobium xiongbiense TaxID=3051184 RepID=UPI002555EC89|nr:LuxR family transcriptional regulator [Psychromicrobium sp. YIM S02556]
MEYITHPGLAQEFEPEALVRRVRAAGGGLISVTGIAGIGKTTWCRQLVDVIGRGQVVAVAADSFESDLPYALIDKLLRAADPAHREEAEFPEPLDAARSLLSALSSAGSGRIGTKAGRGSRTPLTLVIDNTQWIDEKSLIALRYVLPRLAPDGAAVVLAGLRGPGAAAIEAMLGENLLAWPLMVPVTLEPLDTAQVQRYVSSVHRRDLSVGAARRLREVTGGTPLLLSAVLTASSLTDSAHELISPAEERLLLEASHRNPFVRQLEGLSELSRRLVQLLCLLRDPAEQEVVAGICAELGWPLDLEEALGSGLVVTEWGQSTTSNDPLPVVTFRPAHDLVAAAAVDSLGVAERNALCRAIAAALEDPHRSLRFRLMIDEPGDEQLAEEIRLGVDEAVRRGSYELALSYVRGGMNRFTGQARDDYLIEAAVLTANSLNLSDVLELLPQLRHLPPGVVRDFSLLQLEQMTGHIRQIDALAAISEQAVLEHPDGALMASHIALSTTLMALAGTDQGGLLDVVARGREYLARWQAAAASDTDFSTPGAGIHDARLRHLPSADQVELRLAGLFLSAMGQWAARTGDPQAGAAVWAALGALNASVEGAPESPALMDGLLCRGAFLAGTGQIEAAVADLERAVAVALRNRPGWTIGHTRLILAYCYYLQGRYEEASTLIDTARLVAFDSPELTARPLTFMVGAAIAASQGDEAACRAAMVTAEQVRVTDYDTFGYQLELLAEAELARAAGEPERQLKAVREDLFEGHIRASLSILTYRVDALAALGRAEEADRELQVCLQAQDAGWWPIYGSLDWLRGRVEEAYGLNWEAAAHYRAASRIDRFPLAQGLASFDLGRLVAAQGNHAAGAASLRAAARIFRALGARPYLSRTLALLDELEQRPSSAGTSALESLTGREREMAFFAARGLTNQQIAARLFVSPATVNFHIRNVLAKLGLSTRRDLRPVFEASAD